jgi:hypothetical protein
VVAPVSEADKRFPVGPRGRQGAQGERGPRGLSRLQGRAIVVLFLIGAAGGIGNLFWTAHEVHAAQAAQTAEQSVQKQQGAVLERQLCSTLGKLAALKPPPGNPATNPSREFDQDMHSTLAQLGPDLGCGKTAP